LRYQSGAWRYLPWTASSSPAGWHRAATTRCRRWRWRGTRTHRSHASARGSCAPTGADAHAVSRVLVRRCVATRTPVTCRLTATSCAMTVPSGSANVHRGHGSLVNATRWSMPRG
jgi:hypothetical protein